MTVVHLNRIATAVPEFDVHQKFVAYAPELLVDDRAAGCSGAWPSGRRSSTAIRSSSPTLRRGCWTGSASSSAVLSEHRGGMRFFADHAFALAEEAVSGLGGASQHRITHLIVTSCTGFYAPGLDLQIVNRFGLRPGVERTMIGFMGCQAALPGLKLARHIVRSQPSARVLMVNLELCTLHLQETSDLQSVLSFLLFADGCAASLVSAEATGMEIHGFGTAVLPDSGDQITWRIGDNGFLMWLDGAVPATIARGLPRQIGTLLGGRNAARSSSGRSIRAAGQFWTPCRKGCGSTRVRSTIRARSCATTAT